MYFDVSYKFYKSCSIERLQFLIIHHYKLILYDVIGFILFFLAAYLGYYLCIPFLQLLGGVLTSGCIGFCLLDNIHLYFIKKRYKNLGGVLYGKKTVKGSEKDSEK